MHFKDLEEFKKDYKARISNLAEKKTEWIKDFVESQKPKEPVKTVSEMYKEMRREKGLFNR
jgi:hypothetical protein